MPVSAFAWQALHYQAPYTGTPPLHSWRTESGMEGKKDKSLTRGLLLYWGLGALRPFAMGYQWVHQRPLQGPLTQLP